MNNAIKISLTVLLEGRTLVRKESDKELINYTKTERDLNPDKQWNGKDGLRIIERGSIAHVPKLAKAATQQLNITEYAYEHFISNEVPYWYSKKDWSALNNRDKVQLHLARICSELGGISFSYQVLT